MAPGLPGVKPEGAVTRSSGVPGVFAVQCPNAKCRKYMLVEEHDRGKVVPCLLCKTPIRVGGSAGGTAPAPGTSPRRP